MLRPSHRSSPALARRQPGGAVRQKGYVATSHVWLRSLFFLATAREVVKLKPYTLYISADNKQEMNRLQPSNGTAALDYSESPDTRIEGTPRYQHSGTRHTYREGTVTLAQVPLRTCCGRSRGPTRRTPAWRSTCAGRWRATRGWRRRSTRSTCAPGAR
jgi:hypothetical protein